MQTSALSHPRNRLFTAVLAALLAVPLLVVTAPPAAADEPTYELTWNHSGTDTGSSVFATSWTSSTTFDLNMHVTDANELTDVVQTLEVDPPAENVDCGALPTEIESSATATCEVTIDPGSIPTDSSFTITSTLTADGGVEVNATATLLRFRGTLTLLNAAPVAVEVGDEVDLEFEVDNPYSSPLEIRTDSVSLGRPLDDGQELGGDCPAGDILVESGDSATVTCTFGPIAQDTSTGLRVSLRSTYPADGNLGTLELNAIEVQPSVNVEASADPDALIDGGTSTVTFSVESDGGIEYDEIRATVRDGSGSDCERDIAELAAGDTWTVDDCVVQPASGDETALHLALDYETADGTQTYEPDPVVVDLTAHTDALSVDAQYGVINPTTDPPLFVDRPVLPMNPDDHLEDTATLEVTVTNDDGNTDLAAVEVSTDLAGCAETFALAGGASETFRCDGPTPADGITTVTSVTASAEAGGVTLEASDEAELAWTGIGLGVAVDPDWDGIDLELPFVIAIENIGARELVYNAARWQAIDEFGGWIDAPADTCSFEPDELLLPGDSVIGSGCTLLAGDLVDGLSIRGHGAQGGERPLSYDVVELQFDPSGLVTGLAELNGKAFGNVEVELRLLDLLELPRADEDADPAPNSGGNGGADGCEAVGELTDADVGDIVASATSDADGAFCFDDVPPGTYEIVVDTAVDADLDEVVVDGAEGFTTNSPATSEEFFVGFASAALGNPIEAVLSFSADGPVGADDPEPVAVDLADDDEELAATGGSTRQLGIIALLTLLAGAAIVTATSRLRRPATQAIDPDRSS